MKKSGKGERLNKKMATTDFNGTLLFSPVFGSIFSFFQGTIWTSLARARVELLVGASGRQL